MGATTPEKMADIQHLTTDLTILPFDETVAKIAAEIYHELKKRNLQVYTFFQQHDSNRCSESWFSGAVQMSL